MNLKQLSEEEKIFIHSADPFHMTKSILRKNLRGLEIISIESINGLNLLPPEVVNVLLVSFYREFSDQVYNRNDLKKLYNHWAKKGIKTFDDALIMSDRDIRADLGYK
ncbi:DnaD domain protein [Rossellomorea sp. NS-SX7]|uniref:DnaD domain protein n=1 Tax=Rossellomorea sp. NS-SX7 TaxID=3463856 RepID=UPI00405A295F